MQTSHLRSKQKGVGLPEVLVAMLLLGIAVVGFSALQVRALSATGEAGERTQAMAIALDLSERMRLNPRGLLTYRSPWSPSGTSPTACESSTVTCNEVQMANYDIRQITDLAATTLPGGRVGLLTCPGKTNSCIYVSWNTTTPTIGPSEPHCSNAQGVYVTPNPPNTTDCIISEVY